MIVGVVFTVTGSLTDVADLRSVWSFDNAEAAKTQRVAELRGLRHPLRETTRWRSAWDTIVRWR